MPEYIERETAIAKVEPDEYYHSNEVKAMLRDLPAADVGACYGKRIRRIEKIVGSLFLCIAGLCCIIGTLGNEYIAIIGGGLFAIAYALCGGKQP